ncbi:methyl transferase [Streptococcus pyogenes]|nr:methyl transferase [Streptococcus pyogenes]VGQ71055.1 methyl transferase [Streptococcus pyogenes]VGU92979.1 methyl transferase [Streptococcus pyogenes]
MESQGHECLGFCEIDKFARTSYKAMFNTEGEIESRRSQTMILDNLEGKWRLSAGDFLAKLFHSQEDDWDLKILEGLSFLRLLERPNKSNHVFYFWKTSKAYSITTRDGRSPQTSPRWMNWGMMSNGRCLTVRTSKSRKTENGSLLSDILEDTVPDSYFLSEEKTAQLVLND